MFFQEVTGFKNDEWIGKSSLETNILILENKAILIENLKKRNLGLPVEPFEVFFTGQTGRKKFYEVNAKKNNDDSISAAYSNPVLTT